MKKVFQNFSANIIAIIAITAFIICSSLNHDNISAPAAQCNIGYNVASANLKQFMLDSLRTSQFPGGVYAKADLLFAINSLNPADDSIYITDMFVNCTESNGKDLVLASRHTKLPKFVRIKKPCPCDPPRPCCRNSACIPKIPFNCFNFQVYTPTAPLNANEVSLANNNY